MCCKKTGRRASSPLTTSGHGSGTRFGIPPDAGTRSPPYGRRMGLGWLRDRLGDVAEATWEAASEVADAAVDAVGTVAENAGDVIGTIGEVADAATLGLGSAVLNVV